MFGDVKSATDSHSLLEQTMSQQARHRDTQRRDESMAAAATDTEGDDKGGRRGVRRAERSRIRKRRQSAAEANETDGSAASETGSRSNPEPPLPPPLKRGGSSLYKDSPDEVVVAASHDIVAKARFLLSLIPMTHPTKEGAKQWQQLQRIGASQVSDTKSSLPESERR